MKHPPDLLAILVFLLWTILSGYYVYYSWIKPEELRRSLYRQLERLPKWYIFRNSMYDLSKDYWVWQIRILSTLGMVAGILATILAIYLYTK